ncbi:DEAD/DEAH box helicase [bacterium]|nr:MAG: DEAD/DEAH box helicase [bacterium]
MTLDKAIISSIKNNNLRVLLEVILDDYSTLFEQYILGVETNDNPSLMLKTDYASYSIYFDSNEKSNTKIYESNNKIFKTICIGDDLINKELLKYFLRRQFIADQQLFNLYLKRGSEIKPHEAQLRALENLKRTREEGSDKAIAILATGIGKTILAALDAKQCGAKKILFIVHINEILKQTKETFENVIPEKQDNLGFYNGKSKDTNKDILFASIQTLGKQKHLENFTPDYFDYIIIDETHHTAAPTYAKIFSYFKPKFFLGLTATPDRMDRKDILGFYNNNVVFEMDQEQAIEQGYLAPFKYLGFKDSIDYSNIFFNGFKYDTKDLNKHLLIDERDQAIIKKFKEIAKGRKTIGFCASIEHAERSAEKFKAAGISAIAVHSRSLGFGGAEEKDKSLLIKYFRDNKCQVAFVVDMFNEGVDIPDVSCLLFLRPTESRTIFIQHMGRGLRIAPQKEDVLILDFIGNYRTANLILEGLNIKGGIRGLKKVTRDGKDLFVYDLNGCEIVFDTEVVDIFRNNEVTHTKDIRNDVIKEEWQEYASYLEKWTENNLYWKRGQQNQYFEVNFEALKILKENLGISEKEFIKKIQKIVMDKYPRKNMTAGFRALFLSKISGFVTFESPLKPTSPFDEIYKITSDFSKIDTYRDILTTQLEKINYWNPIYGSYNKYVDTSNRVSFKDFRIYPFFFIYDALLKLMDEYGSSPSVTKFEFNTFLAITKEHSETKEVVERILRFRDDEEKQQTQKLLTTKNKIDPRFYGIIHYNKYLEVDKNGLSINPKFTDELRTRLKAFNSLYSSKKLILYEENAPNLYSDMLYSISDILDYHNQMR